MENSYNEKKVIIFHGYPDDEVMRIMNTVKQQYEDRSNLIFAKTTPRSLQINLEKLIKDLQEDHEYLKKNPPEFTTK